MTVHTLAVAAHPAPSPDTPAEQLRVALYAAVEALVAVIAEPGSTAPAPSTDRGERLLTPDEVAARLGISKHHVYRLSKRWAFTRRIGRAVRFSEAGLVRWIAAQHARGA